jgi:poly(3-hydroxybutyrate) depolymerase
MTYVFVPAAVCILLLITGWRLLHVRPKLVPEFDGSYYWTEKETYFSPWIYAKVPAGFEYFLYIPSGYDYSDADAEIPLIVVFHGQSGKYSSLTQLGRQFLKQNFQQAMGGKGCAVLVVLSRIDYHTDPPGTARLIKNILLKYPCIDRTRVAGYGFSQGAAFVVELAANDPSLFKAVISGSGYYEPSAAELIRAMPVCFYTAVSENDAGIFEHGRRTGRRLALFCSNSRYVQYKSRYHFWLEMDDGSGRKHETVQSWLVSVMND